MKKRILIAVYALLLCVTACFAWLSAREAKYVTELNVDFDNGALTVAHPDVQALIGTVDADGEFQPTDKLDFSRMVPGKGQRFQIKLKNNSDEKMQKIKLGVAIKADVRDEDVDATESASETEKKLTLLDMIYVSVIKEASYGGGDADLDFKNDDNSVSKKLSDASVMGRPEDNSYFLWICDEGTEIIVPPNTATPDPNDPYKEYITINCSVEFAPDATAEYQNKAIEALAFRVE